MTATPSEPVEIYCVKCKTKTASRDIEAVTMKNGRARHPRRLRGLRHQEVPHRRPALTGSLIPASWRWTWASTTYQLLSALDGLAPNIQSRSRRLDDAIDRALAVPADEAAFRTAAVGRRPYISARTGPEGLLGSRPPPEVPQDWTALSVDGSHIDVTATCPCAAT